MDIDHGEASMVQAELLQMIYEQHRLGAAGGSCACRMLVTSGVPWGWPWRLPRCWPSLDTRWGCGGVGYHNHPWFFKDSILDIAHLVPSPCAAIERMWNWIWPWAILTPRCQHFSLSDGSSFPQFIDSFSSGKKTWQLNIRHVYFFSSYKPPFGSRISQLATIDMPIWYAHHISHEIMLFPCCWWSISYWDHQNISKPRVEWGLESPLLIVLLPVKSHELPSKHTKTPWKSMTSPWVAPARRPKVRFWGGGSAASPGTTSRCHGLLLQIVTGGFNVFFLRIWVKSVFLGLV